MSRSKELLGTRKNVTPLRAVLIVLLGAAIAVVWNIVAGGGAQAAPLEDSSIEVVAAPSDCATYVAFAGVVDKPCAESIDDVISPDTRQALGSAAAACAVGFATGGQAGCGYGLLGSLLGSLPYDGTWE